MLTLFFFASIVLLPIGVIGIIWLENKYEKTGNERYKRISHYFSAIAIAGIICAIMFDVILVEYVANKLNLM